MFDARCLMFDLASSRRLRGKRGPVDRRVRVGGFTLAELLVTMSVLVLLVFLFTQLLNSAATTMTLGNKHMDADSQARQLLDRMAIDFAQMVQRPDVDYYLKSSAAAPLRRVLQPGNDQIAFYSTVRGYYPSTGSQSPVSLVAYRVNSISSPALNKLERMGKGLVWNGVSTTDTPVVFIPTPVASPLPVGELPVPPPVPLPTPAWPQAGNMTADLAYELIGPQVFRFEYYYLLKGVSTTFLQIFTDTPWDTRILHTNVSGMRDVAAIVVAIAVIEPKAKTLLDAVDPTGAKLKRLNGADGLAPLLVDFDAATMGTPGQLLTAWRTALDANTVGLPQPAISGIRLYERYFYLSQ